MSTEDLRRVPAPFVKIQITTRGSPGSSEGLRFRISALQSMTLIEGGMTDELFLNTFPARTIRPFVDGHVKVLFGGQEKSSRW